MINRIINASAGTGKTYTILNAALEGAVTEPEIKERLASTVFLSFSTSAVEEIKERLYEMTAKTAAAAPGLRAALRAVPEYRVFTIHGFAVELAKLLRYELGMPGTIDFVPMEDYTVWDDVTQRYFGAQWNREKVKAALKLDSAAMKLMVDAFFILSDQRSVKKFIREKGDSVFYLLGLGDTRSGDATEDSAAELLRAIGIKTNGDYEAVKAQAEGVLYGVKKELDAFCNFVDAHSREMKEKREKLAEGYSRKGDREKAEKKLGELEDGYRELLKSARVPEVMRLLDACSGILGSITADIGENHYIPLMLKDGLFDFDAVVYLVIRLIKDKGRPWLMKRLREEGFCFDSIYIDEAQDSDIVQNYLITLLSEDGKDCPVSVTVVGDTKQSIYQWRSAYPDEFRAFYNEAKELKRHGDLRTTWRLENRDTLEYLNGLFMNMQAQSQGLWDYDKERDQLEPNPKKTTQSGNSVRAIRLFKNTDLAEHREFLQKFITGAQVGILGRSRAKMKRSGLTSILKADFKYRTRLETGGDELEDMEINDTFYPEYFLVRSLLYTQSAAMASVMPHLLLFTPPGTLALSKMKVAEKERFPDIMEEPHRHVTNLYSLFSSGKASKAVYTLLERYNLWEYMWHGTQDGQSAELKPEVLSRNINSLLTVLYMYELKMRNPAFSAEDLIEGLNETATVPYEWYGTPGGRGEPAVEISTVHSSKGLQYDRVIVMDDFDSALKPDPHLGKPDFSHLYSVAFSHMLKKPQMRASFFPYLDRVPAKMMQNLEATDRVLWPGAGAMFKTTNRRIISEKFNLLYVALTRTRSGLVIIDMPANAKYDPAKPKPGSLSEVSPPGFEPAAVTSLRPEQEEPNQKEIFYLKLKEDKKLFPAAQGHSAMTVRDLVSQEAGLKMRGAGKKSAADRTMNIEIGSEVHALLEKAVKGSKDAGSLAMRIAELRPEAGASAPVQEAHRILSGEAAKTALADLAGELKDGIIPEVPVWGIRDGVLIKGVMDGISISADKCVIVEYKTVFDADGEYQKAFGGQQVKIYAGFVKEVFKDKKVEGKVVGIS